MFGKKVKSKKINKKNSTELGQLFKKQLDEAKEQFQQLEFESKSEDGTVRVVATGSRKLKAYPSPKNYLAAKKMNWGS